MKKVLGANARQSGQLLQFCPILAVLVRASRADVCTFSGLGVRDGRRGVPSLLFARAGGAHVRRQTDAS